MLGCPSAHRYPLSVCECAFLSSKVLHVETLRWWFLVWCGQAVKLKPTGHDSKLTDSVSPGKAFSGRPPHEGKRQTEALLQRAWDGIPHPVHVPYLASLDPYPNLLNNMVHWGGNVACWWDIRRKCVKRVVQAVVRVFVVFTWSASSGPPEASGEWAVWAEVWLRSRSLWCSLGLHPPDHLKHQVSEQFELKSGWGLGLYGAHWVCILQTTWSISEQVLWAEVWLRSGSSWCSLGLHPPDHLKHQWASTLSWGQGLHGARWISMLRAPGSFRRKCFIPGIKRVRLASSCLKNKNAQQSTILNVRAKQSVVIEWTKYFIWMSVQNNRLLQNEQNILSECQCKTVGCYRMNKIFYLNVSAKQSVVTEWTNYFIWMSVQNSRLLQNEQNYFIWMSVQNNRLLQNEQNYFIWMSVQNNRLLQNEQNYFIWMSVQNNRLLQNEQNYFIWMSVQNNRLLQNEQNYFIWMSVQNNRLLQNEQNYFIWMSVQNNRLLQNEQNYFIWMSVQNNRLL